MPERLIVHPDTLDDRVIAHAADVLLQGGILVYPTDTIYGLGADPFNAGAVSRLQAVKQRFEAKPILLIAHSLDSVRTVVRTLSLEALQLAEQFWPGPLTLVLPARDDVPEAITQGSGTVGVRIPSNTLCLRLTELFGGPITSTSANITGQPTPPDVGGIIAMLGEAVNLYVDAGPVESVKPSTIVDLAQDPPRILREGAISCASVRAILPSIVKEG